MEQIIVGVLVLVIIVFFILFIKKIITNIDPSNTTAAWDEMVAHAIQLNASHLLIEEGKQPQIKIDGAWSSINVPNIDTFLFNNLKSFINDLPYKDNWHIDGLAKVYITRNDENIVEMELRPEM